LSELKELNLEKIKIKSFLLNPVRIIGKYILTRNKQLILKIYKTGELAKDLLKNTEGTLKTTPTLEQLKLYGNKAYYQIDKAESILDYKPKISIEKGLQLSSQWLRHHSLIDRW